MRARLWQIGIGFVGMIFVSGCGMCDWYCARHDRIYGHQNGCCYPQQTYQNPCYCPPPPAGTVQPVPATNYYCP